MIKRHTDSQGHDTSSPVKSWYDSKEWKQLRIRTFVRDRFTCQMCGKVEGNTSKLVGDHRQPHRGDRERFFEPTNIWTLCKSPCHDGLKQKAERGSWYGQRPGA